MTLLIKRKVQGYTIPLPGNPNTNPEKEAYYYTDLQTENGYQTEIVPGHMANKQNWH